MTLSSKIMHHTAARHAKRRVAAGALALGLVAASSAVATAAPAQASNWAWGHAYSSKAACQAMSATKVTQLAARGASPHVIKLCVRKVNGNSVPYDTYIQYTR